jgi:hypothetical protein
MHHRAVSPLDAADRARCPVAQPDAMPAPAACRPSPRPRRRMGDARGDGALPSTKAFSRRKRGRRVALGCASGGRELRSPPPAVPPLDAAIASAAARSGAARVDLQTQPEGTSLGRSSPLLPLLACQRQTPRSSSPPPVTVADRREYNQAISERHWRWPGHALRLVFVHKSKSDIVSSSLRGFV